jgi:hypothetical protein
MVGVAAHEWGLGRRDAGIARIDEHVVGCGEREHGAAHRSSAAW